MKKIIIPLGLKPPQNREEIHTEIIEIWKALVILSENQAEILNMIKNLQDD